jgi:hypothetical protein
MIDQNVLIVYLGSLLMLQGLGVTIVQEENTPQ